MSAPYTKLVTPITRLSVVCRGCLADTGEMKNMYEWGLNEDYFRVTAIETTRRQGVSELLCASCEAAMISCKEFRDKCQLSDKILKTSLTVRAKKKVQKFRRNQVTSVLEGEKLSLLITAPKTESRIGLPCPYHCKDNFYKKPDLQNHLKKTHSVSEKFEVDLQYHCPEPKCAYHVASEKKKWFTGRKFLNQHMNKVHKIKTYFCNDCSQCFATETELQRHLKCCNFVYVCEMCDTKYNTNEKLMVHLKRKHPNVHEMYKNEKAEKRKTENDNEAKKKKTDEETKSAAETVITEQVKAGTVTETWIFNETDSKNDKASKTPEIDICDSPKKSFATQIPEDIRNDVTLPSWQSKNDFETKTDEISTQVAFEDLLSLKSQNSEDAIFFSDPVSLSDIQTQTFPLEFGLSRSNKETQSCINSQTQSPDLSIKETQTCFCHYDSPKTNFRLFDSLSSSPASINHTSAETQTADPRHSVRSDVMLSFNSAETQTAEPRHSVRSDVMLSFNSAETQTCFDDSSNDSL